MTIQERLFALQDGDYGDFHSSLLPGFPRGYFIGIRVPVLRKFVKEYKKEEEAREFLTQLPHTYYEESMVHAFLIAEIKDYDTCIKAVEAFLPYINNWAVCDGLSPKVFKDHKPETFRKNKAVDTFRPFLHLPFWHGNADALVLDENFRPEYLEMPAAVRSEEYYVNMMTAWFLQRRWQKQMGCCHTISGKTGIRSLDS